MCCNNLQGSMVNILIVGRGKYALAIVRAFRYRTTYTKEALLKIILANHVALDFGAYSKYVDKTITIARPDTSDSGPFIKDLQRVIDLHSIDLIIPGAEEVFYVLKYKDKFLRSKIFSPSNFEFLEEVHNKVSPLSILRTQFVRSSNILLFIYTIRSPVFVSVIIKHNQSKAFVIIYL